METTLARISTVLEHLDSRLHRLETNSPTQETLIDVVARQNALAKDVDDIRADIKDIRKPPWQMISVLVAIFTIVGGIVAFGVNSKIDNTTANLADFSSTLRDHMSNGHPASVIAMIEANKEAIQHQIIANQRELDSLTDRVNRENDRTVSEILELKKRTGVLFNKGDPY